MHDRDHDHEEAFERSLCGNQAAEIFAQARDRPEVMDTVAAILTTSYRLFLGGEGERFITRALAEVRTAVAAGLALQPVFAGCRQQARQAALLRHRDAYKQGSLTRSAKIGGLLELAGHVVDVGAGSNRLGQVLLQANPAVSFCTGVDVHSEAPFLIPGRLAFVTQADRDVIPLADACADAVVFRFSLHHMPSRTQIALLGEARRCLVRGGHLVVFEDTFSPTRVPLAGNVLHDRFIALGGGEHYRLALALLDASSCLVMEETMAFPFTFRPLEEWQILLGACGFSVETTDYWGMPFFSLFQAPLGVLVARPRGGWATPLVEV